MIWMWIGVAVVVLATQGFTARAVVVALVAVGFIIRAVVLSKRKRARLAAAYADAFAIRSYGRGSLDNPRYAGLPPWPAPPPRPTPVPRAAPPARPARRERRDGPVPPGPVSAPVDTPSTIPVFVSDSPPAEPSFSGGGGDFGGGGSSGSWDGGGSSGGDAGGGSDP